MQEQAEIQEIDVIGDARESKIEKEHENTRRNKMAPPPPPPPPAVSLPVHHVDYTDKENEASFEDDIQSERHLMWRRFCVRVKNRTGVFRCHVRHAR